MKKLAIILTLFMFVGTVSVSVASTSNVVIEKKEGDDKKKKKKKSKKSKCCAKSKSCTKDGAKKSCEGAKEEKMQ